MTSDTSTADFRLTQGILLEARDGSIVLGLPGTDYQLHLQVESSLGASVNQPVAGSIHARARRVDVLTGGGRFIEPLYGRPRGVQGRIISIDPAANAIVVDCGCPMVCQLVVGQRAVTFAKGMLVRFDVERGAFFMPA